MVTLSKMPSNSMDSKTDPWTSPKNMPMSTVSGDIIIYPELSTM